MNQETFNSSLPFYRVITIDDELRYIKAASVVAGKDGVIIQFNQSLNTYYVLYTVIHFNKEKQLYWYFGD